MGMVRQWLGAIVNFPLTNHMNFLRVDVTQRSESSDTNPTKAMRQKEILENLD